MIREVDYSFISPDTTLLLFGDSHFNHLIRDHIIRFSEALKNLGFSWMLLESDRSELGAWKQFNERKTDYSPCLYNGPDPDMHLLIPLLAGQGWNFLPIDPLLHKRAQNGEPTANWMEARESHMFAAFNKFQRDHPSEKAIFLVGQNHLNIGSTFKKFSIPSFRTRCRENCVASQSVGFVGGMQIFPKTLSDLIENSSLSSQEFFLNIEQIRATYELPEIYQYFDRLVHLPVPDDHESQKKREEFQRFYGRIFDKF